MIVKKILWLACCGLAIVSYAGIPAAWAQKTISHEGAFIDATDYSDAGLDIGNAGFWFANFGSTFPEDGRLVDHNDQNSLPSWVLPDFDPNSSDYSFGGQVTSSGGHTPWNFLTLPNGVNALSGSLVDAEADDNSNNTIKRLLLGPGVPQSFLLSVVIDNTNNTHDPAKRVRARAESADGVFDEKVNLELGVAAFNGIADVHTFRYDGWEAGDFIKLQLNSGVAGIDAGIAGLMFDVIPEPTSAALLLLGGLGLSLAGRRRQ